MVLELVDGEVGDRGDHSAVKRRDEREHVFERHHDQFIVAVGMARVPTWVAVDLGEDAKTHCVGFCGGVRELDSGHEKTPNGPCVATVTMTASNVVTPGRSVPAQKQIPSWPSSLRPAS